MPYRNTPEQLAMREYLCQHEWQVFATLTFAPRSRARLKTGIEAKASIVYDQATCNDNCPGRRSDGRCDVHKIGGQTSPEFTKRVVSRFAVKLNEALLGRRYSRDKSNKSRRVRMFVPWEHHKYGHGLHCHPLIGNMPSGKRWSVAESQVVEGWRFADIHLAWKEAQLDFGLNPGFAMLKPFRDDGAIGYVCKYILKDAESNLWSCFGPWDTETRYLRDAE